MATVNETIVTGRKFRKLVDEATKLWQRISFWTKASDVEFNDAKTAELKVGAIDGITDSLASTSSRIAASAKSVNQLSNDLAFPDGTKFYPDKQNGKYGFNTDPARGADTFSPFNQCKLDLHIEGYANNNQTICRFNVKNIDSIEIAHYGEGTIGIYDSVTGSKYAQVSSGNTITVNISNLESVEIRNITGKAIAYGLDVISV